MGKVELEIECLWKEKWKEQCVVAFRDIMWESTNAQRWNMWKHLELN